MAVNFINSVKPNNSSPNYYLQNCDVDFVIDNRTTSGAALTGVCHKTELYDGMQIVYWLVWGAGTNATLNLTLGGPDGTGTATTGAIPCYYSGSTRLTTHYPAGNAVRFTYRKNAYIGTTLIAEGWWADANYYSDSNYDVFASAMKLNAALYAYSLCAITNTYGTITPVGSNLPGSYWEVNSFTQTGGYSVTTKKATTKGYIPWKLFWNSSSTDLTTAHGNTSTISGGTSLIDLRYTVNGTDTNICTARAPFFLVGSIGSDGLFYLKGNQATTGWWQSGVPTTATNDVYWFVGMSRDAYRVYLAQQNWFYKFVNGVFTQFDPLIPKTLPWSSITNKPSTYTPTIGTSATTAAAGNHTHGSITNAGAITSTTALATGDGIVFTDNSDSGKLKRSSIVFDGSTTTKFLSQKGTWESAAGGTSADYGVGTTGFSLAHYTKNGNLYTVWLSWSGVGSTMSTIYLPTITTMPVGTIVGFYVNQYAGPDYGSMSPVAIAADLESICPAKAAYFPDTGSAVINIYTI